METSSVLPHPGMVSRTTGGMYYVKRYAAPLSFLGVRCFLQSDYALVGCLSRCLAAPACPCHHFCLDSLLEYPPLLL